MKISPPLAQKIVDHLQMTLNQEVNFMNLNGLIIASTDKDRINTLHEGALLVVKTKSSLFIEYDGQYEGTTKGINMPIYFDHQIIGVVGLTGEKEVEKDAQIVKAMTEILIKESYLNEVSSKTREKNRLVIESLLLNSQSSFEESLLELDFSTPYRVIVGSFDSDKYDINHLYPLLESCLLPNHQHFFTITSEHLILISSQINLTSLLTPIQQEAFNRYQANLNFGIGLLSSGKKELTVSYERAKQALTWLQTQKQEQKIVYFEDLDLGILIGNTSQENKQFFINKVLGSVPKQELDYFRQILMAFAKHNGSIPNGAQELFIHKNTLQYQLNKIKRRTGYDPKNYYDFSVLYLAFLLESSIKKV